MTHPQAMALARPCRLAIETMHPALGHQITGRTNLSLIMSVLTGYEPLEAGYGGPVWHASIAPTGGRRGRAHELEMAVWRQLAGVGDHEAGWWVEVTDKAVHVRLRLSEADMARLPAEHRELVDVRGTPEGWALVDRLVAAIHDPYVRRMVAHAAQEEMDPMTGEKP